MHMWPFNKNEVETRSSLSEAIVDAIFRPLHTQRADQALPLHWGRSTTSAFDLRGWSYGLRCGFGKLDYTVLSLGSICS